MKRVWLHWILSLVLFVVLVDNLLYAFDFPVADSFGIPDPECLWYTADGIHISEEDRSVSQMVCGGLRRSYKYSMKKNAPYHVLFIGCSFTFGAHVKDEDAYVWRMNELMPQVEFDNGGVGGYGAFTSLMRLRRLLAKKKYDLVIYGYIDDHKQRNARPQIRYVRNFGDGVTSARYMLSGDIVPRVELTSDFRFIDHYPKRYEFYGDSISPLMNFLTIYYTAYQVRHMNNPTENQQHIIIANIVERQALLSAAYGSKYMLMSLQLYPNEKLLTPLMHYFNNNYYRQFTSEDSVAGKIGNHPNAKVHRYWAEHLAKHLQKKEIYNSLIAYPKPDHRNCYDLIKDAKVSVEFGN